MIRFKNLLSLTPQHQKSAQEIAKKTNDKLLEFSFLPPDDLFKKLYSHPNGLNKKEARRKQFAYGLNQITKEQNRNRIWIITKNFNDPLTILLIILATISYFTGDLRGFTMILGMVVLSVLLRSIQESKADEAAQKLRAMIRTTAQVLRDGVKKDLPLEQLVPGDIIYLNSGDMIPADIRIIESKDLFVNQATLTGESLAVEKHADLPMIKNDNALESQNLCFLGTNVESGTAKALVIFIGKNTYLGNLADSLEEEEPPTNFDIGIKKFTFLIIKFIAIMVPLTFLINGFSKGNWFEALLFALAVAVGLAPEMLPMITMVNLTQGAIKMSKQKVIIKHLSSIQNFGAMDILCTDKTGTLTEGRVVLEKYLNLEGNEDVNVLKYTYLNSYYQTGLNNLMDAAILKHSEIKKSMGLEKNYKKIDELPFDFSRRRMSVVVQNQNNEEILICKGAVEEIMMACTNADIKGKIINITDFKNKIIEEQLNEQGFRVVAVAYKKITNKKQRYSLADENNLTLLGFLAFLDPPKESSQKAIAQLEQYGVKIKILTGDNEIVTKKICEQVGIPANKIILGSQIENWTDEELKNNIDDIAVFAKLKPHHKEKIVLCLRSLNHTVGFLGDGINDAPALRAADVGISVDSAADIAKESSDIILLEKSLLVLKEGVIEGRKIFSNIIKYIEMSASSNFGNMFSVVGGSLFLPFLPMAPIQILTNNLLYDISQTSIPTDKVDQEFLLKPRQWKIDHIKKFIIFLGPISSIFDFATYFAMLYIFNCWHNHGLFQTGWFVESLATQTLIIYIIRTNKIPFLQSWPSWPLLLTTTAIVGVGIYLPFSPLAKYLGFVPLPPLYWGVLLVFLFVYFLITQLIKMWFVKRYKD